MPRRRAGRHVGAAVKPEAVRVWHAGEQLRAGNRTLNSHGLQLLDDRITIPQRVPFVDPRVNCRRVEVVGLKPTDTLGRLADQLEAQDVQVRPCVPPCQSPMSQQTLPAQNFRRLGR